MCGGTFSSVQLLYMSNPPKSVTYLKQLVSAARAIVTYQVGLPLGCVRAQRLVLWLRPHKELSYPIFEDYLQAVKELPIGSERLKWNREALREKDKELEAANGRFRDKIFETCYGIIDSHGEQSNDAL
jgi:hypothetical protein